VAYFKSTITPDFARHDVLIDIGKPHHVISAEDERAVKIVFTGADMTASSCPLFPIYQRQGRTRHKYKVGYIDAKGAIVIDPHFDDGLPFSEGLAAVAVKGQWGYIDVRGFWTVAPTLPAGNYFHEGLAVANLLRKRGYINKTGQWVVPPQYDIAGAFSEGLGWVILDNRYGFVNVKADRVVPLNYQSARSFSGGLAPVRASGKWGYIDKTNQFVIEPVFDGCVAGPFNEGLARVAVGERWGYINRSAELHILLSLRWHTISMKAVPALRLMALSTRPGES
jgi:hypothetical protein